MSDELLLEEIADHIRRCGFHSNLYHSEEICLETCVNLAKEILAKVKKHYELREGYVVMAERKEAKAQERERIIGLFEVARLNAPLTTIAYENFKDVLRCLREEKC